MRVSEIESTNTNGLDYALYIIQATLCVWDSYDKKKMYRVQRKEMAHWQNGVFGCGIEHNSMDIIILSPLICMYKCKCATGIGLFFKQFSLCANTYTMFVCCCCCYFFDVLFHSLGCQHSFCSLAHPVELLLPIYM